MINKTNEQLVELIKAGTDQKQNLEALFLQNAWIVDKMAKRYTGSAELDDLRQECFLALTEAVNRFDGASGIRFITFYYYTIKWHLSRFIHSTRTIRIPSYVYSLIMKYRQLTTSGDQLSNDQLCQCLNISEEILSEVIKAEQLLNIQSLNTPAYKTDEECEAYILDVIADDSRPFDDADEKLFIEQRKAELWAVVDSLTASLAEVIHKRFEDGQTLEQIAKEQGLCIERIRQKETAAIKKLRQPKYADRLLPFVLNDYYYLQGIKTTGPATFQRTRTSSTERAAIKIMEIEEAIASKRKAKY